MHDSSENMMSSSNVTDTLVCCVTDCTREATEQLHDSEVDLLKYREKRVDLWTAICKQHHHTLVSHYESYQKYCCDPPQLPCSSNKERSIQQFESQKLLNSRCAEHLDKTKIVPGNRVCWNCNNKLQLLTDVQQDQEDIDEDFDYSPDFERTDEPTEPYAQVANKLVQGINSLANCDISPIKNHSLTLSKKEKLKKNEN